MARDRPGWRVADIVEADDESGRSSEVVVERGILFVAADGRIVGGRR